MEYHLDYLRFYCVLISCVILLICINSSEVPRPRGVSLSRAPLYNPEKDFTCFDGSLTIPFSQVNDDYCDCSDGSDEPGTAACPNGFFHCTNAGHKPLNIASSRVNDGVCDCCDASDEYANSNAKCVNNCNELGRSAREEAQKQAELLKAGKQIRSELIQKGTQLKQEKKDKLTELEKSLSEAERLKSEKEELKKQIEELENIALEKYREIEAAEKVKKQEAESAKNREEATETFKLLDSNADGKVDISELKTRQTFDKDKDGEISDEEAKYFLNEKDVVELEEFVTDAWSRIKPFLMMDAGLFKPPVSNTDGVEPIEDTQDVDAGEAGEDIEQDDLGNEADEEEEEEEEEEEVVEEATPEPVKYDEETQKLIDKATDARKEFTDAEKEVRHIQSEIKRLEEYFEKDFGPEDEFATLEGECFEYSDYEYVYKLCPFDKAVQKPKSNSIETRLGTWSSWVGLEDNKYSLMLYDRGQSCWNGPQRSTHVRITCGSESKLTSVSEPNRCEYLFDFITPAACKETETEQNEDLHDEL